MKTTWKSPRGHTKSEEATYGVYVFLGLHWENGRDRMKLDRIERLIPGALIGRAINTGLIPEAMRTYLALCQIRDVTPEAI
jgi:hypothetical protein